MQDYTGGAAAAERTPRGQPREPLAKILISRGRT